MKKQRTTSVFTRILNNSNLKMKFTLLFLFTTLLQVSASSSYGQNNKVTMDVNGVALINIFQIIEDQTDFHFFYNRTELNVNQKIDFNVDKKEVTDVLGKLFNKTNISYQILGKQIILKNEEKNKIKTFFSTNQKIVEGIVTDKAGIALVGVSVILEETGFGITTDFEGRFKLNIEDRGKFLLFSHLGYEPKRVAIGSQSLLKVILEEETNELEEIVLVGYGTQKRKDITGSVSKIDVKEINKSNNVSIDNALVGRASGVHVITASGAPGASAAIRIRGITSIFGNNEPLYVIDGLPIEIGQGQGNSSYSANFSSTISPLASINPQDIESIDILKDASATAIYGSRGANGVVIINTKKGSYSSVPSISLSSNTSISKFTNEYSVLNSKQFHEVIESAYANSGTNLPQESELYPYGRAVDTDWQNETKQTALNTNYYLNANGGSLNGSSLYSLSAGVTDQKGAIFNTNFKRNNLRTKLETKLSDKLRVGTNFNYSESKNKGSNTTFYYQTIKYRPDVPIFDESESYGHDTGNVSANPYARSRYPAYVDNKSLILSLFGEYELSKKLMFKSTYSYTTSNNMSFRYTPSHDVFELKNNRKGSLNQTDSEFTSRILDNTLTFSNNIDRHNFNAVAGISYTQNKSEFINISASNFPDDEVMVTPGSASTLMLTSGGTISGLSSSFLRANYNFDHKYYFTFTGRADKSTKFGPENRWGYFPSGAIAWRISNEEFLKDVNFIEDLKIRTSYGKTGSANFSDFQYATFFASGSFYNNNNGVISNTIPNPFIKWETTDQLDVAIDYSLWDRRINGSIGYFNKKTSDQILLRDVSLETGGSSQFSNIGDFLNKGFEFQVGIDVISNKNFQWTTDLNLTTIKSKVLKLNGGYYRNLREGESTSYFAGYKIAGIFQNQQQIDALNAASPSGVYQSKKTAPGDFMYVDVNNDGFIGGDDTDIIGNAAPDFFGGWNNIIRFGSFELSALFNFSVGNYLYNMNKKDLLIFNNYTSNYSTDIQNAWSLTNTNTDIPRLVSGDPNNNRRDSDFFIEDASFFKLKNLNVTYKFNPKILNKLFIQRASISLSASNIFTITSYSGLDPEVNYNASSNFNQGYDSASYPSVRTFTLGLNLNL